MEDELKISALKYAVGTAVFCPDCKRCLDWRNAVLVDVKDAADGKPLGMYVGCGACAEGMVEATVARLTRASRVEEGKGRPPLKAEFDLLDGRFLAHPRLPFVDLGLLVGV